MKKEKEQGYKELFIKIIEFVLITVVMFYIIYQVVMVLFYAGV